jgi:Phosphotransferase enzyme family
VELTPESPLITSLSDITPEWLTAVLRRSRVLQRGSIVDIALETGRTSFCTTARLRITYSADTSAPQRLFVKFSLPEHPVRTPESGAEVLFYNHVAPRRPGPFVRCFDAVFSAERSRLHILLEDLSGTHVSEPPSQLPPRRDWCYGIVDAVAMLHAAWWEQPPWEVLGLRQPDQTVIDARIADVRGRIARFVDFLGDRLPPERCAMYRMVLQGLPRLYRRLVEPRAYTVVHDDLHVGNVLYPRDSDVESVRLVDWQTWHIDLGPKDLAHMMALFWFPERRRRLELPLLRRYHERLYAHGVTSYSWDECWADYRVCVLRKLFHPAWQWDTGHHPNIWWNHLERVCTAFEDLHCAELLE